VAEQRSPKAATGARTTDELKSLVKSRIYDMTVELEGDLVAAGATGLIWGVGGLLAAAGFSALVVSLGLKASGLQATGTFYAGLGLVAGAAVCIVEGARVLPRAARQQRALMPHARA
jgi:hypothetical protein